MIDWSEEEQRQRTRQHARAAGERALWLLRARGRMGAAGMPPTVAAVIKAAVAGATTTDSAALAELTAQSEALVAPASAAGLFDALRGDAVPGQFHASYATAISRLSAAAHQEGRAIPVTRFDAARRTLREQTAAAIIVVTADLLRVANAPELFETMLREGLARATDDIAVPQLVSGATSVAVSGSDSVAIAFDLRRALQAIGSGSDARFRLGVGVDLAKRLSMLVDDNGSFVFPALSPTGGFITGGPNAGIPVTVTESLTADAVLTDARALLMASGEVEIETASAGAIEMDTAPSNASNDGASPPAPNEQNLVSLFQTNAVALRARRTFDWTALRSAHTCVIAGAGGASGWGVNSAVSPPL